MYNTQKNKKSKSKKNVFKLGMVGHINESRANVFELRQNVLKAEQLLLIFLNLTEFVWPKLSKKKNYLLIYILYF